MLRETHGFRTNQARGIRARTTKLPQISSLLIFIAASASPTPSEQPIRGISPTLFDLTRCCPERSSTFTSTPSSPKSQRARQIHHRHARAHKQHTVSSKVSTSRGSPRRPPNLTSDARVTSRRDRHLPTSTHRPRAVEEPGSREKTSSVGHMIPALWPQATLLLMVVPVLACLVALRRRGLQLVIIDFHFVAVSPRQSRVKAALSKPGWAGSCPCFMDRGYEDLLFLRTSSGHAILILRRFNDDAV